MPSSAISEESTDAELEEPLKILGTDVAWRERNGSHMEHVLYFLN